MLGDPSGSDKCEVVARARDMKAKVQVATCVLGELIRWTGACMLNSSNTT